MGIDVPIARQTISDMTGSTLHSASRLLSAWGKDGIVASERKKIAVAALHQPAVPSGVTS